MLRDEKGLTDAEVERFVADGFVRLPGAFPRAVADAGRALLWARTGCDPDDRRRGPSRSSGSPGSATDRSEPPRTRHGCAPRSTGSSGAGRWRPRGGLGTFPIRFPHPDDPDDDGRHVEGSHPDPVTGGYRLNLRSRGRALLMLFLFSDVGLSDAPTRIRVGSHLDVPRCLPCPATTVPRPSRSPGSRSRRRRTARSSRDWASGDVHLCHPFLVHVAQHHRGSRPRFRAQPPLEPVCELDLDRVAHRRSGWAGPCADHDCGDLISRPPQFDDLRRRDRRPRVALRP
ncbi:MAG: phytanoyl-CoA dioxygenase [Pseudonocardia sp.]